MAAGPAVRAEHLPRRSCSAAAVGRQGAERRGRRERREGLRRRRRSALRLSGEANSATRLLRRQPADDRRHRRRHRPREHAPRGFRAGAQELPEAARVPRSHVVAPVVEEAHRRGDADLRQALGPDPGLTPRRGSRRGGSVIPRRRRVAAPARPRRDAREPHPQEQPRRRFGNHRPRLGCFECPDIREPDVRDLDAVARHVELTADDRRALLRSRET